jgi:hypothetical protein
MSRILLGVLALSAFTLQAGLITTAGSTPGTTVRATSIDDTITGAQMGGLVVTGTFSNATVVTCIWSGSTSGCSGTNGGVSLSLNESGDTFLGIWNLSFSGSNLTNLLLDGLNAGIAFDRTTTSIPFIGTPGSSLGVDASGATLGLSNLLLNGSANYTNQVAVGSAAAVGDLFTQLSISFGNGLNVVNGTAATFTADTDRVVPEPATWAMLGTGLLGVSLLRRRK